MDKFLIILSLSVLVFLAFLGSAFAIEIIDPCEGVVCSSAPSCEGDSWPEYQCGGTACPKSTTQIRTCGYSSSPESLGTDACGCEIWGGCIDSPVTCGSWADDKTCNAWQQCKDDGNARTEPYCACQGTCLEAPENPRYYDNPTYSDNPGMSKDPGNIFLPVKLDWDDVLGWGTWPEGPQSYSLNLNGSNAVLNISEEIPKNDFGECFLGSDASHNWDVKACCGAGGTNCGPQSSWNFKTAAAPEPLSPADPDWAGTQKIVTPAPITLDWCDADYPFETYIFRAYRNGVEEEFSPMHLKIEGEDPKKSEYFDDPLALFTKDLTYQWKVAACASDVWDECIKEGASGPLYSQIWSVQPTVDILAPKLISPPDDPTGATSTGLPLKLVWETVKWAHSYVFELTPKITGENFSADPSVTLSWDRLSLNAFYKWKVKACAEYKGKDCDAQPWSEEWIFKTTGAPPKNLKASSVIGEEIILPVKLDWDDVSGAGSYYYEIATDPAFDNIVNPESERVVGNSQTFAGYPTLKMGTTYWWKVKTCADKEGKVCGAASEISNFTTVRISPPALLSPGSDNPSLPEEVIWNVFSVSWKKVEGAQSYWYEISGIADEKTLSLINFVSIDPVSGVGKDYQWRVRACIDSVDTKIDDPKICSDWSSWKYVKTIEPPVDSKAGLIPCGRSVDDPATTDINEREPCQLKHIFLLLKNILNFVLWKLIPMILVLEVLISGIIFYLSRQMNNLGTVGTVRTIWKWTGIGLGVIFFAWVFINLLLALLGFQISIFGTWWQLKF